MKRIYTKPHKSLKDQIDILKSRGLAIADEEKAEKYLSTIGYYRLSSYWFVFEEAPIAGIRSHHFKEGVSFDDVVSLYVFDQKLRIIVLEALERFEITARTSWAYYLSEIGGSHPHLNKSLFKDSEEYDDSLKRLNNDVEKARVAGSIEICHYLRSYDEPKSPPIWVVVSCLTFGELFRWVKNTRDRSVKIEMAKSFDIPGVKRFESVARSLTTIRNICAHHGRLWDIKIKTRLPLISSNNLRIPFEAVSTNNRTVNGESAKEVDNRLYNVLVILIHVMLEISPDSSWPARLETLIDTSLNESYLQKMGFPLDWKEKWRKGLKED